MRDLDVRLSGGEWQAASRLLDEVLELPPAQRMQWVDALSGDRNSLKPLLRQLLARQPLLETNDFLGAAPPIETFVSVLSGTDIGPYRLVRELGRGGMGTVWLAERPDALIKRAVALKLPHPTLYDEHFAERFARERDILAALTHRSIARLYDAGIAASGQPFLALEYVQGTTLTDYCDQRALLIEARIALFLEVLHAVQYAHALRVVHRDLKPSNILVTESGEVRLLDFGIAKLISEGRSEESELTRVGGRALTLEYAAPEQIARQPVGVESDVYSLGVILYELLCGARPYRPRRDSLGALEEEILHVEPLKPSAAVASEEAARRRGLTVARLRTQLRGDLDTITLKALQKQRSSRYTSAEALALDLQRHLNGQPVAARADSALYRLGKFAIRNKLTVSAGALVVSALAAGAVVSLWQARIARAQAVTATREAARAQVVQNYLLDIFRANSHLQSDPQKARQTTARELLDVGARRVGEDLKDVPAAEEQVLGTLSDMYEQLGLEREAAELQLKRVAAAKRAYGERDPRVVMALSSYAKTLANGRDRDRIAPVLQEATQILDAAHDDTSILRADVLVDVASYYRYTAPAISRRAADASVRLLDAYHPNDDTLLLALQFAGRARVALGQYPAAVVSYQQDLDAITRQVARGTAWDIAPLAQLAGAQAGLLQVAEAEKSFRASLALSERLNGDTHNETLQSQSRLAALLHATSRRAEGRMLMRHAWESFQADPGKKDNSVAGVLYGLYGQSLMDEGDFQAAAPLMAAEVEQARAMYPESTLLAQALLRQASLRISLAQYDAAEVELHEALTMWRHVGGSEAEPALENPYLFALARLALQRAQGSEVRELLSQLRQPAYAHALPIDLDEVRRQMLLAQAYLVEGAASEALPRAHDALQSLQSSPMRQYFAPVEAQAALILGATELRMGLPSDARSHLERALELLRVNDAALSPVIAQAELSLAACLTGPSERTRSHELASHANAILAAHHELNPAAVRAWSRLVP